MHYGTNQKVGGPGQDLGACAPWPQPKTATDRRHTGGVKGRMLCDDRYQYTTRSLLPGQLYTVPEKKQAALIFTITSPPVEMFLQFLKHFVQE